MSDDSTTRAESTIASGGAPVRAHRELDFWRRLFKLGGWVYFALHSWVTVAAFGASGFFAALATFIAIGLGDVVWAYLWWGEPGHVATSYAALAAGGLILGYWAVRRWTDRYLVRLTIAALDFPPDIRSGGEPVEERRRDSTESGT